MAAALCFSCEKLEIKNMLFPYADDVNTRVAESLGWNEGAGVTTVTVPADAYRFYACSDIHIEDDRPANFQQMALFFAGYCGTALVSAEKFTVVIQNNTVIPCLFLL